MTTKKNILDGNFKLRVEITYISRNDNSNYHTFMFSISPFSNIIEEGYKYLKDKLCDNEDYGFKLSTYEVISVKILNHCEGCQYEAPGQRAHMNLPYGCLSRV